MPRSSIRLIFTPDGHVTKARADAEVTNCRYDNPLVWEGKAGDGRHARSQFGCSYMGAQVHGWRIARCSAMTSTRCFLLQVRYHAWWTLMKPHQRRPRTGEIPQQCTSSPLRERSTASTGASYQNREARCFSMPQAHLTIRHRKNCTRASYFRRIHALATAGDVVDT